MKNTVSKIEELINIGWNISSSIDYYSWEDRVYSFLSSATDIVLAANFHKLISYDDWRKDRDKQIGHLEGLAIRLADENIKKGSSVSEAATTTLTPPVHLTKKVFVVHGHDNEAKETVARFIE